MFKKISTYFLYTVASIFFVFLVINFFFIEKTVSDIALLVGPHNVELRFALASDMRGFGEPSFPGEEYMRGGLEAIKELNPDFIIVVGDMDPVNDLDNMIKKYIGENFIWYPVMGNHELPNQGNEEEEGNNLRYLRDFVLSNVNSGPKECSNTTYSFNYTDIHFVVLNEYCDISGDSSTDGKISELLSSWLQEDLESNTLDRVIVIGHEPAFVFSDEESLRIRHEEDSLNQYLRERDYFWKLLEEYEVDAYLCGHTHNYSSYDINGTWQIDSGHMRGIGDDGALSTFVFFTVYDDVINVDTYRAEENGLNYSIYESFEI